MQQEVLLLFSKLGNLEKIITYPLSHNANHFISINTGENKIKLCTRCTGMLFGLLSSFPFLLIIDFNDVNGFFIVGISVALIFVDLIYWGLTRTQHLPDYMTIRVSTGFLLGVGILIGTQANVSWTIKIIIPILFFIGIFIADRYVGKKKINNCSCS